MSPLWSMALAPAMVPTANTPTAIESTTSTERIGWLPRSRRALRQRTLRTGRPARRRWSSTAAAASAGSSIVPSRIRPSAMWTVRRVRSGELRVVGHRHDRPALVHQRLELARTRCRPSPSRGCRSARRRRSAAGRWRAPGRPPRAAAGRPRCSTGACAPGRPSPRARAGPSPGRGARAASTARRSPSAASRSRPRSASAAAGRTGRSRRPCGRATRAVLPSDRPARSCAADGHRAAGRPVDAGDHVHQRRLAAARPADDRDELARGPPGGRRRRAPGTAPRR